jgi:hypothetical protein
MELKIDLGSVLAGIAAILSAWVALKEKRKKSSSESKANPSKSSQPFALSDSERLRLSELWELSEKKDSNEADK